MQKIQSAIALTLLSLSAQADDRYNNPQKQLWERQANIFKGQAASMTERAAALKERAEVLISANMKQSTACREANAVKLENYAESLKVMKAHNAARADGIKYCKETHDIDHSIKRHPMSAMCSHVGANAKAAIDAGFEVKALEVELVEIDYKIVEQQRIVNAAKAISADLAVKRGT